MSISNITVNGGTNGRLATCHVEWYEQPNRPNVLYSEHTSLFLPVKALDEMVTVHNHRTKRKCLFTGLECIINSLTHESIHIVCLIESGLEAFERFDYVADLFRMRNYEK
jgi:hypothetical protein